MGFNTLKVALILSILPYCFLQIAAMRPLKEEVLILQSLQRGRVPPSGSSGCTYTPGRPGTCTLGEMNFAGGYITHSQLVVPDIIVHVAPASVANDNKKQDKSS